jgi:hypothetical protein
MTTIQRKKSSSAKQSLKLSISLGKCRIFGFAAALMTGKTVGVLIDLA